MFDLISQSVVTGIHTIVQNVLFGKYLLNARERRVLSQRQLAAAADMHQSDISQMEQGKRLPSFEQLQKLAGILKVSLQWFLSGANVPCDEIEAITFQLQDLGIVDLHAENARVPGAFRPTEEVIALTLVGNAPPARIIEAIPAVLAWNYWHPFLLRANARIQGKRIEQRLAWLADIAITIHKGQGFPGGCPSLRILEAYVRTVKPAEEDDVFEYAGGFTELPPVSLRWKMHYPAKLAAFRDRAERLHELRKDCLL